jgi:murein DD-endopeptidase MepM/ murein hydrolase activator NlpD
MSRLSLSVVRSLSVLVVTSYAAAAGGATFSYDPPGELVPGSGEGRFDENVYAPGMRFPLESGEAYLNSQVWGRGGNNGGGGGQCDAENYAYPWRDNYCETRSWDMPLCPSGQGHQGQDMRAATCEDRLHWVVAAEDGTITNVGNYSVYLTDDLGTRFDYLHMSDVAVAPGDKVKRGQRLGKVSNAFNGNPTTIHLHFNIRQNIDGIGSVFVSPYLSLVRAYEDHLGLNREPNPAPVEPPPLVPEPEKELQQGEGTPAPEGALRASDSGCAASARASSSAFASVVLLAGLAVTLVRRRRRT